MSAGPARAAGRDWPVVLALVAGFAAMWALLDPLGPFPVNDDWAYSFAVRSLLEHGRFQLTGFSAPNLIAQAYWGALFCLPFGYSHEALQVSNLVAAALGLVACYALLRELGADRTTSAVAAATLGANPLFLVNAAAFMTDAPFSALVLLSLWLFVRGVGRGQTWAVAAAYAVALLALFSRQFALALPVAFGLAAVCRGGLRARPLAALLLPPVVFAGVHLLFQHWVIATGRAPAFAEDLGSLALRWPGFVVWATTHAAVAAFAYFGAFTLGFLALLLARQRGLSGREGRIWWGSLGLGLVAAAALLWRDYRLPTVENVLQPWGVGPLTLHDVTILQVNVPQTPGSAAFWTALTVAGCCGTVVIGLCTLRTLGAAWASLRRVGTVRPFWREALLLGFCVAYGAMVAATVLAAGVFDRYLLPFVGPLCAFLFLALGGAPGRRAVWTALPAAGCLLACAALAVAAGHDYFSFHRARWAALGALEASGVAPASIDGGFEYNGTRLMRPGYRTSAGRSWWWVERDDYMVTLGPLPGYEVLRRITVRRWLAGDPFELYVMRRTGAG